MSKTFSAICRKTSGRVVKSALYLSTGAFWEKKFFGKKISNFWEFQTLCLKVLAFIRKRFWHSRQNCNLPVQKNNLRKLFFEIFLLVESLFIFDKPFAAILQESFRQVCPNCILPAKKKLLGNFSFQSTSVKVYSDFDQKLFRRLAKKCGRVFETAFYLSGITFLEKKLYPIYFF